MLRVKVAMLIQKAGLWFYKAVPFTGVAFATDENHSVEANEYHEGRISGRYLNEYLESTGPVSPKVDWACLGSTSDDEPNPLYLYQGRLFSGIAYFFGGQFCRAEFYCQEGRNVSDVFYSESGKTTKICLTHSKISQTYEFDETGNMLRCRLSARPEFKLWVDCESAGSLAAILVEGNAFEGVARRLDEIYFASFVDKRNLFQLHSADDLWLSGDGINDKFFCELLDNQCISDTLRLSLMNVAVTSVGFDRLVDCVKLRSLSISGSPSISTKAVKLFRSRRPDCTVEVDRVVIHG